MIECKSKFIESICESKSIEKLIQDIINEQIIFNIQNMNKICRYIFAIKSDYIILQIYLDVKIKETYLIYIPFSNDATIEITNFDSRRKISFLEDFSIKIQDKNKTFNIETGITSKLKYCEYYHNKINLCFQVIFDDYSIEFLRDNQNAYKKIKLENPYVEINFVEMLNKTDFFNKEDCYYEYIIEKNCPNFLIKKILLIALLMDF